MGFKAYERRLAYTVSQLKTTSYYLYYCRGGGSNFTLVRQKYKQHVKHLN